MSHKETYFEAAHINNIKRNIKESFKEGDPIEAFLKNEYGVENPMNYESPDLGGKEHSDYIFTYARGNVSLQAGKILTVKDTAELSERVANLDFKKLQFKP